MSLQGLVDATATALGGARELYGQAPTATGLPSTSGLQNLKTDLRTSLDTVPATWGGRGGEGYKQAGGNGITALDNVISADGRVGPQVVSASNESRDGRAGMNGVVSDTRSGVNAIAPKQRKLPPPNALLRVTPGQIRHYASVSGDHNPIHTNAIAAKLLGFPTVIAHGMFSAAAVLANIEGQLPDAVKYSVRFAKPVVLPARAGLYVDRSADGWDLTLRHLTKGYPHLTGTVAPA
ncbi:MaoC/PaaZ C-terminal domain-containing protein [Mycolicibacterium mengxianglii]|uniref:MaoC/PaaZ C-terminal domain-containing protein n=1 Tax=Mycolicibacterium mengxianglii TaxID=2736649 RepID=UPI0022B1182B|nr:MaoC/PaaZ C-terminal domain-containing protein [Mycolicibacterium mengxianglii]